MLFKDSFSFSCSFSFLSVSKLQSNSSSYCKVCSMLSNWKLLLFLCVSFVIVLKIATLRKAKQTTFKFKPSQHFQALLLQLTKLQTKLKAKAKRFICWATFSFRFDLTRLFAATKKKKRAKVRLFPDYLASCWLN